MRVCPRCGHLSSSRAEFCKACDYRLVLFIERYPKKGQPRFKPSLTPAPRKPCPFCGSLTRAEACPSHLDLIESEAL